MKAREVIEESVDVGRLLDLGPWTTRQKGIVGLVALAVTFDGMDIQLIGFAIPAIAREWGVAKASFASVLAAGLFGATLGSAAGGLVGDRLGRRSALLMSVAFFGLMTLCMASTHSLTGLLILRFCAGLGIGGALPNAATLAAEYTPANRRPLATTLTIVCIPLGGLIAGLIAANLLGTHSWRALFVIGGVGPLLLGLMLFFFLPESPRFLARVAANDVKLRRLLGQIGRPVGPHVRLVATDTSLLEPGGAEMQKGRVRDLFAGSLATDTVAIWSAFFLCLLTVYLAFNWLPSVLTGSHFTAREATQGLSAYNFGGIAGAVAVGWWISLKGSRVPMLASGLVGIVSAALTAWMMAGQHVFHGVVLGVVAVQGLSVNAVQTTMYALATHLYATRIRATGVALALAIGRTGAIASAFLGARLLAFHASTYFVVLSFTMAGALVALALIKRHILAPTDVRA